MVPSALFTSCTTTFTSHSQIYGYGSKQCENCLHVCVREKPLWILASLILVPFVQQLTVKQNRLNKSHILKKLLK